MAKKSATGLIMRELVHTRDISLKTYDLGDQMILVEGHLLDNRLREREGENDQIPRVIHNMIVRLKVKGPELIILEAEAEMPHVPMEECRVVMPWIKKLEGMSVVAGFTMKMKDMFGDVKGCNHLTSLIIAMGPEAVQGYLSAYRGRGSANRSTGEEAYKKIINTCYLWREDGPLVSALKKG
jgi:hypothetical protein